MRTLIACLLSATTLCGSLTFTGADTDRVQVTAAASINDLTAFTMYLWMYPTTGNMGAHILMNKPHSGGGTRKSFKFTSFGTPNQMDFLVSRATTPSEVDALNMYTTNAWNFVAATYDESDNCRMFTGTLTTTVAEASYGTNDAGSGATNTDGGDLFIGNGSTGSFSLAGRIAVAGFINRRLTLGELKALQFRPRVVSGTVGFWVLGYNGTGTQPDWSGSNNNGTVTGAVLADHVPIGAPFAFLLPLIMREQTFQDMIMNRLLNGGKNYGTYGD